MSGALPWPPRCAHQRTRTRSEGAGRGECTFPPRPAPHARRLRRLCQPPPSKEKGGCTLASRRAAHLVHVRGQRRHGAHALHRGSPAGSGDAAAEGLSSRERAAGEPSAQPPCRANARHAAASEITTAARRTAPPPPAEACARPRPGLEGASAGGAGRERQGMPSWLRSSDMQAQAHERLQMKTRQPCLGGLEGRHAHAPSRGGPSPGAHPPSLTSLHSQRPQTESLKRAPGAQALQPCRCRRPCLACGSFKVEPSSYGGGARLLPLAARPRGRRARRAGGSPVRRGSDRATQERRVALQKPKSASHGACLNAAFPFLVVRPAVRLPRSC